MSDRYDSDVMDDLFYEAAEGPSAMAGFEDEGFEEGFEEEGFEDDGFEEEEAYDEDGFDEGDYAYAADALEEAVADALGADDADEFLRRLARGLRGAVRTVGRVARQAAPVVGRIARTVAPIASALPIPQAQAIGRIANVVGRLMADEADEFEAIDEMLELAEAEDLFDAAAPVVAGLSIRRAVPNVARMPRPARRQLVRQTTRAAQTIARRQGVQAARAVPAVVRAARRTVARQGQPAARALPRTVARTAARIAANPQLTRRLARAVPPTPGRRIPGAIGGVGGGCPACRRRGRTIVVRGPARIIVGR
jgi:hypothetical protein